MASASPPLACVYCWLKHNHALGSCFTQAHLLSLPQRCCHKCLSLVRLTSTEAAAPPPGCHRTSSTHVINYCEERLVASRCSGTRGRSSRVKALQLAPDLQAQLALTRVQRSPGRRGQSPPSLSDGPSNQSVWVSVERRGHERHRSGGGRRSVRLTDACLSAAVIRVASLTLTLSALKSANRHCLFYALGRSN